MFATILASGHELDAQLYRPHLACLRLAGLGGEPLPPAIGPVLDWASEVLSGAGYPLSEIMVCLGAWERRLTPEFRSALLARLGDAEGMVCSAAAKVLAADIAAKKFGLPLGEVTPGYP